jgi:orotidine-5'-phosphate decarboxylase
MYVVGATQAEQFTQIRKLVPDHFLLVPGVGAQGGDLQLLSQYGMNTQCGLLVNASRAIIYASNDQNFARQAATEARKLQQEMALYLEKYL